jgi:orotidine-5'-phosphate decarboxylase
LTPFADRLVESVRRAGTPLCVGFDIFPERIPRLFGDARSDIRAVLRFGEGVIELAGPRAGVFKPQMAFFEQYGAEGVIAAGVLSEMAQTAGMISLLDAKRGDIGSTAEAYARATIGAKPGFDADAVTVNPYLGRDALEPFVRLAEDRGRGVAVLVRTSNPGAGDLQDIHDSHGAPLWTRVAEMIRPFAERLTGHSGWSGLMAVAGATYPDEARTLRALLPHSIFLVPGYGAQGASADDAVAGFTATSEGRVGGVVSSSRAILYPPAAHDDVTLTEWRGAMINAIDAAALELRNACLR